MNPITRLRFFPVLVFSVSSLSPCPAQVPLSYTGKPFHGAATVLPGRLEVEAYDEGGKNVAWFDATVGNEGNYGGRNPTDVDLAVISEMDHLAPGSTTSLKKGDPYLRSVNVKDWMKFTVGVRERGRFSLWGQLGVQPGKAPSQIRIDVLRGSDSIAYGNVPFPNGSCVVSATVECYHYWDYAKLPVEVDLDTGLQVIRLEVASIGFNLDYLDFILVPKAVSLPPCPPGKEALRSPPLRGVFDARGRGLRAVSGQGFTMPPQDGRRALPREADAE